MKLYIFNKYLFCWSGFYIAGSKKEAIAMFQANDPHGTYDDIEIRPIKKGFVGEGGGNG